MKNKILLVFIMILTLAGVTSCTVNDGNENKKEDPCLVETNKAIDDFINNVEKGETCRCGLYVKVKK